jgi:hypothetical protein
MEKQTDPKKALEGTTGRKKREDLYNVDWRWYEESGNQNMEVKNSR